MNQQRMLGLWNLGSGTESLHSTWDWSKPWRMSSIWARAAGSFSVSSRTRFSEELFGFWLGEAKTAPALMVMLALFEVFGTLLELPTAEVLVALFEAFGALLELPTPEVLVALFEAFELGRGVLVLDGLFGTWLEVLVFPPTIDIFGSSSSSFSKSELMNASDMIRWPGKKGPLGWSCLKKWLIWAFRAKKENLQAWKSYGSNLGILVSKKRPGTIWCLLKFGPNNIKTIAHITWPERNHFKADPTMQPYC